eukprot:9963237-Ditylum_brightwellii.AAC.1
MNSPKHGTKPAYIPAVYNLPPTQTAMVPYASVCMAHMSPQKVSQLPNTTPTDEYVPTHRWNTSPHVLDNYSIHNLTDGINFNKQFLPNSTDNNSNKDAFLYHDYFFH